MSQSVDRADVGEAIRLMNVATQTAATDPRTGMIDMDLITTGHTSMERDAMASLASEVSQVLTTMKGQDLTVNSLRQALLEQQSMDVQANELQSVLRRLAQEEGTTFQYNERNGQIKVF